MRGRGWLPETAKVLRKAQRVDLQTLGDLFVPSLWPCALSGLAVENHGIHAFRPIRSGRLNIVEGSERHVPTPFWETAVQAGLRVSVLDAPMCAPPPADAALDGLRFVEWGSHPPVRVPGSFPPSLISGVIDRHGPHPCREDDPSAMTADELLSVQVRLCEAVRAAKTSSWICSTRMCRICWSPAFPKPIARSISSQSHGVGTPAL